MDDEVARLHIKTELTTRDEYLESGRFVKLSSSGYDLTPWTEEETRAFAATTVASADCLPSQNKLAKCEAALELRRFQGIGERGLYAVRLGGLPVFSSGYRIDTLCDEKCLYFTDACDPEHVRVLDGFVFCARSGQQLGMLFLEKHPRHKQLFQIEASKVSFLNMRDPLPVWAQPENFWGTEGQFRGWNSNELVANPLSY